MTVAFAQFTTSPISGAVITWTDSLNPSPVSMGTGNGYTSQYFFIKNNSNYTPTNQNVYIKDWEGNQLQYTTPRTNLSLYSQDGTNWTAGGSTITANLSGAPDGSSTLNKIVQDSSTGQHKATVACDSSTSPLGTYTARWIVKAGIASYCEAGMSDGVTGSAFAAFSFLTNTIISITATGSWTAESAISYSMGGGFYAIEITATKGDATLPCQLNFLHYNGTTNSFTGDGTTYFYGWGSMLQTGSTVGSYIETSGAAASHIDYSYDGMPNLIGSSLEYANIQMDNIGITPVITYSTVDFPTPAGIVTAQSPSSGSTIIGTVSLTVTGFQRLNKQGPTVFSIPATLIEDIVGP